MTLWHLSPRTLAARYTRSLPRALLSRESFGSWRLSLRRRYTTGLDETQQDEAAASPSTLPTARQASVKRVSHSNAFGGGSEEDTLTAEDGNPPKASRKMYWRANRDMHVKGMQHPRSDDRLLQIQPTKPRPPQESATASRLSARKPPVRTHRPMSERFLKKQVRAKLDRRMRRFRRRRVERAIEVRTSSNDRSKPKWVSIRSMVRPTSVVSSVWNRQLAIIARPLYQQAESVSDKQRKPTLDPAVFEWVQFTLDALQADRSAFSVVDIPKQSPRKQQWMFAQISFWLLHYEPDRMVDFLRATHMEPYPPINWIEDSLNILARQLDNSDDALKVGRKQRLLDLFLHLAHRETGERLRYTNEFIRCLLPHCTAEEVVQIYYAIKDHGIEVHGHTLLHFATRCAKESQFEEASDALLRARDFGVIVNRENFRSACSTVIRSCMSQADGLRVCLRLVSQLVDTGLKLNGPICDIIMLNAVDAGDVNTAFSVFRSLVERGLQPRERTFAVLLRGCKLNIDDADMLNSVIRDAISKINVRQSPLVATEILHCLALHHVKHNPNTAFRTVTEAYAQLFDMEPLRLLGLPLPQVQQQRATEETPMPPSPQALGFMISASISDLQTHSTLPDDIAKLYARWREQVEAGHPLLSLLATTDHVANTFLMAFIRTPRGLIHASRVVRDMQRPLPPAAAAATADNLTQSGPTVQTWSIFLHGFTRHNKLRLADQVLMYMRSKGVQPNDVTWSTLVMGYARSQDVEGTFEAIRQAEREGVVWSRWTDDGVRWLRDQGRVAREMERRRAERERLGVVDFSEEVRGHLSQKLAEDTDAWTEDAEDEAGVVGREEGAEQEYSYVPSAGFADSAGEVAEQSHSP